MKPVAGISGSLAESPGGVIVLTGFGLLLCALAHRRVSQGGTSGSSHI